jgi:hypothetical protein
MGIKSRKTIWVRNAASSEQMRNMLNEIPEGKGLPQHVTDKVEMSQVRDKNYPPNAWVLWVLPLDIKLTTQLHLLP